MDSASGNHIGAWKELNGVNHLRLAAKCNKVPEANRAVKLLKSILDWLRLQLGVVGSAFPSLGNDRLYQAFAPQQLPVIRASANESNRLTVDPRNNDFPALRLRGNRLL